MTSQESISQCDFSEPRRLTGGANRALTLWQTTVCSFLTESWQGLLGNPIEITLSKSMSTTAFKAVSSLPDPGFAAKLAIGDSRFVSLFAFPSQLIQALVYDMLGNPGEDWPEVRPLTAVETSMMELLLGGVARSISQAWPDVEPLISELASVVARPMRSRFLPPDAPTVSTRITMTTQFGPEEAVWLLPISGLESLGITHSATPDAETLKPSPRMHSLAKRLPVQLVVQLGHASLTLGEMTNLKVGDYLPLDQGVYQPLEGHVDGQLQWIGNPCRLGKRQGFQIIATKKN